MTLTLVTGPANAAKAGEVLGGLRARLEDEPILVVPTFQDVEHAQRELAERGAVFGARVLRFEWLFREIADRGGYHESMASPVQRELIVEDAVRRARLAVLAESAAQPGFVRAAARFVAELGRGMVDPARLMTRPSHLGGRRARGEPTPRRWPPSIAVTATGSRPRGSWTRSCLPGARSTPLRRAPERWGAHAAVRLRLRRLHGARA